MRFIQGFGTPQRDCTVVQGVAQASLFNNYAALNDSRVYLRQERLITITPILNPQSPFLLNLPLLRPLANPLQSAQHLCRVSLSLFLPARSLVGQRPHPSDLY